MDNKLKADLLDKIADAISNEWSAKPGWHLHCAAAALTAIEDAGCVIAPKEPMRSEDVFTGDDVENIAEWQEWASRTGNDQLAGMLRHWWKKAQKTAEALRSLKRSDKTESDNGGCQADAGIKGETVSREGALQASLSAIERLRAELKASIHLNAHDGVDAIRLDPESVECMVTAVLASIERLGLGVVPVEPNMEIVKAGQNYIGWNGWKPMVSAVNLVPSEAEAAKGGRDG